MPTDPRHTKRWQRVKYEAYARDRAADATCWVCGRRIDYRLAGGPWAYEPDHYYAVKDHPELAFDLANLRPSHAHCNRARGDGSRPRRQPGGLGKPSREW